jgi:hypothetical protein
MISVSARCSLTRWGIMQTFRTVVHFCFDAATALLYTASIAIAFAAVAIISTKALAFGLLTAALSFFVVATLWGLKIWRRYRPSPSASRPPLFAH